MPFPHLNDDGRPRKFQTAEELLNAVNGFFAYCDSEKETSVNDKGQVKTIQKPYTMSGLCVYLGITKETWSQYSKLSKYAEVTTMAKLRVENYVEENSLTGKINPIMSIFNLKNNFSWTDRIDINTNIQPEQLNAGEVKKLLQEKING